MSISKLVLGLVVLVTGLFANLSVLAFEGDTYNWANESLYIDYIYIETDKFFIPRKILARLKSI